MRLESEFPVRAYHAPRCVNIGSNIFLRKIQTWEIDIIPHATCADTMVSSALGQTHHNIILVCDQVFPAGRSQPVRLHTRMVNVILFATMTRK